MVRRTVQPRIATVPAAWLLTMLVLGLLSTGCGLSIPADPDGTLQRVRGGVLRVGASPHEPWIVWGGERAPTGSEAVIVGAFAETLDARVEWSRGGEEDLIGRLERGELDLVVGGLTAKTPWVNKAAITKPYRKVTAADGTAEELVFAARNGENAFLVELERFLLSSDLPGQP